MEWDELRSRFDRHYGTQAPDDVSSNALPSKPTSKHTV